MLATLANRRYEAAAAMTWARKAVQAAKEQVHFEPSDVKAWTNWAHALGQLSSLQMDAGEVAHGIATERAAVALPKNPHSPKGLAPHLAFFWEHLSSDEAISGNRAGAEQSMQVFARNVRAQLVDLPPNSPWRGLGMTTLMQGQRSEIDFQSGAPQQALRAATAAIAKTDAMKVPTTTAIATGDKKDYLRFLRGIAAQAAIQVGHYAQAEKIARKALAMPVDPFLPNPQAVKLGFRSILAHAIAMQGHKAEARKTLQPVLDYGRKQLKAGAYATSFRNGYAYALYVSAIAQPADAAGRKQCRADLAQAAKLIAGASQQAQHLTTMRYVSSLIAKARAH